MEYDVLTRCICCNEHGFCREEVMEVDGVQEIYHYCRCCDKEIQDILDYYNQEQLKKESELVLKINSQELYRKVLDEFGPNMQKVVCMEELAELQQALSKDIRHNEHNVEEEIADVEIMIGQMKLLYDTEKIKEFKAKKLKRIEQIVMRE